MEHRPSDRLLGGEDGSDGTGFTREGFADGVEFEPSPGRMIRGSARQADLSGRNSLSKGIDLWLSLSVVDIFCLANPNLFPSFGALFSWIWVLN